MLKSIMPGAPLQASASAGFGNVTPAAPSTAGDRYVTSASTKGFVTMDELRRLAESRKAIPAGNYLDINNIRFGIEVEMENVSLNSVSGQIESLPPWQLNPKCTSWKVVPDQSLAAGSSAEAVSPVMTLASGDAQQQIRQVYSTFKAAGAKATKDCGLHIHVDASVLGPRGLANLMKLALEQENLMFRLSQNGNPVHRGALRQAHGQYYYWCRPLAKALADPFPMMHADSSGAFRNALYGAVPEDADQKEHRPKLPPASQDNGFKPPHRDAVRYFGVNFNSFWYLGTIEFRFFDAVEDPEQALADVQMALGMVRAAAEDDYTYLKTNGLDSNHPDNPVSRESFAYFLDKVAKGNEPLRRQLVNQFVQSGGKIVEEAPITDPRILNVVKLMESGCNFLSDGQRLESPFEIVGEIGNRWNRQVSVVEAGGGTPTPLRSFDDVQRMVDERQAMTLFPPEQAQRIQTAAADLRARGYTFRLAPPAGSNAGAPVERDAQLLSALNSGKLECVPPGNAVNEAVSVTDLNTLEVYRTIECSEPSQLAPEAGHIIEAAQQLQQAGLRVLNGEKVGDQVYGRPITSRLTLLNAVRNGTAQFPFGDRTTEYWPIRSADELTAVTDIALDRVDNIRARGPEMAATADAVRNLRGLEAKGVTFSVRGNAGYGPLNRVGQLEKLNKGDLHAHTPQKLRWDFGWNVSKKDEFDVTNADKLKQLAAKLGVT
jgi:hypothetical protein